jgi:hypothetical protein
MKKKIQYVSFIEQVNNVDEENSDICDLIYQSDYLQIFGLVEYNDIAINAEIKKLYENDLVKTNVKLKECMKKTASMFLSEDLELGFMVLFSYDYLFATHLCICDILENKEIQDKHLNLLAKLVFG